MKLIKTGAYNMISAGNGNMFINKKILAFSGAYLVVFSVIFASGQARADGPVKPLFESSDQRAYLVELYTSEGCSSCPPAERWMNKLREDPGLWETVVPVSFHVTMWDRLGWKDSLATTAYSNRHRAYAKQWNARTIYTPCMVINGEAWRGWSLKKALPVSNVSTSGKLSVFKLDENTYEVIFNPKGELKREIRVQGALLGFDLESDVKAGENRGRLLKHNFAVLQYGSGKMVKDDRGWVGVVTLPKPGKRKTGSFGLAAWVNEEFNMTPLQAVGGYL